MRKLLAIIGLVVINFTAVFAQQATRAPEQAEKNMKVTVDLKKDAKVDIYVDGKKFDFPLEMIDQNGIESISVIKNKSKKYPNGAILINTKKSQTPNTQAKGKIKIIIDGKISSQKQLRSIKNTKNIKKINIVKGDQAKEKYNAPNGVIIITTK